MTIWYGHQRCTSLLLTGSGDRTETKKSYNERGWPTFEAHVSRFLKLSYPFLWPGVIVIPSGVGNRAATGSTRSECSLALQPPVLPDDFKTELGPKIFTNGKDRKGVADMYEQDMRAAFGSVTELSYEDRGWGDEQFTAAAKCLSPTWSPRLERLRVSSNNSVGEVGMRDLRKSLAAQRESQPSLLKQLFMESLNLDENVFHVFAGSLGPNDLPQLQVLSLKDNHRLGDSGIKCLAEALRRGALPKLEEVDVRGCNIGEPRAAEGLQRVKLWSESTGPDANSLVMQEEEKRKKLETSAKSARKKTQRAAAKQLAAENAKKMAAEKPAAAMPVEGLADRPVHTAVVGEPLLADEAVLLAPAAELWAPPAAVARQRSALCETCGAAAEDELLASIGSCLACERERRC